MPFVLEYSGEFDNNLSKKHTRKLRENMDQRYRKNHTRRVRNKMEICSTIEQPLSRDEALLKMDQSSEFRKAVYDFDAIAPQAVTDDIDKAVQLDYTRKLQLCIKEGKYRKKFTNKNAVNNKNNTV
mmetsp:Transcript_4490/g.5197  ORF Transcript_4490/g.5197 Transcript_4490/m.5197 type:complete len:126 (-) Transcript_4490:139-516(-)